MGKESFIEKPERERLGGVFSDEMGWESLSELGSLILRLPTVQTAENSVLEQTDLLLLKKIQVVTHSLDRIFLQTVWVCAQARRVRVAFRSWMFFAVQKSLARFTSVLSFLLSATEYSMFTLRKGYVKVQMDGLMTRWAGHLCHSVIRTLNFDLIFETSNTKYPLM